MSDVESDFDDLDELLPTFQQPKPATLAVASATAPANRPAGPAEPPAAAAAGEDDEDDEAAFAAAFERNMALMLAGLAGGEASSKETGTGSLPADGAWERAFNEALAGDASSGPAAAGSGNGVGSNADSSSSRSRSGAPSSIGIGAGPNLPAAGKADFKQTVRETVDRLKASSDGAGSTKGADQDPLAALLASLGLDPDSLDGASAGLGGAGGAGDEDDDGVLERMMQGLMSKDVLYEPMCELAEKYPPYLASPAARALDPAQLHAYTAQSALVAEIVAVFRQPTYTEDGPRGEAIRSEVQALMGRMQDLGSPPAEVMGEMPDFEIGADGLPKLPAGLDGPEGCVIC